MELRKGQGIFINTGIIHGMSADKPALFKKIVFSGNMIAAEKTNLYEKYISLFIQSDIAYIVFDSNTEWQISALEILDDIYAMSQNSVPQNELGIHIALCKLWKIIYEHREDAITGNQVGISSRVQIRLRKMLRFIADNYDKKISLDDISKSADISKSEATRCFQLGIGNSPLNYTNEYRLYQAKEQLSTSILSVSEIALNCGFDNCSYFDRLF